MNRLFFALDIAASDKQTIAHWRDNKFKQAFKAIPSDNFHITLAFLGNTSSEQQQQLISDANKFAKLIYPINKPQLLLTHLGLFKKPKVMYLGLQTCPCWLNDLANNLSQAAINIGLFQENRAYCPHLSIYRKASAIDNNSLEIAMTGKNMPLKIKSFSLYQSISSEQGVVYTPINTWKLAT
jgi:2'-5' RNA ligase